VQNLVVEPSTFTGKNSYANGYVDIGLNARLRSGKLFGGGLDLGRTEINRCFVVNSPQALLYCDQVIPWSHQAQVKFFGSYPLPAGFAVSGTFQNLPGVTYGANQAVPNSQIAPSLGRNLAACGAATVCNATAVVPLVAPYTLWTARRTQVDVRLTKRFKLPRGQLEGNFDVYNLFNSSAVLNLNSTYATGAGSKWQFPVGASSTGPEGMLWGRMIELGGRVTF
jgi:hypothetical protein